MRVIVGRAALLVIAVAAAVSGVVLTSRPKTEQAGAGRFVCPMHPEVISEGPSDCPICGMALEPAGTAPAASNDDIAAHELLPASGGPLDAPRYSTDFVRHRRLSGAIIAPAVVESVEGDNEVLAWIYKDDVATIAAGDAASFALSRAPSTKLAAHVTAAPPSPWDASMMRVHLHVDGTPGGGEPLHRGAVGFVSFERNPHDVLVVPAGALIASREGQSVLVYSDEHQSFARRTVQIGKSVNGWTTVVGGLSAREKVVSINTFFLEAERRLHAELRAPAVSGP